MEILLKLQPKQKEAFIKSQVTPVLFYGGAKGGGKSYLVRARELYRRLKYPKTKGLIIRKTYPELLDNHIVKFFEEYPITREWFNKQEKAIIYPNGSITKFSYLQNTNDVYTYQGREYEDISIDEATQHEEITLKILRTSNRTSNEEFVRNGGQVTFFLTGNPGGIGHQWVKRIFIDKQYTQNEDPNDFDFVQAFVQDNQAMLKVDPKYIERLKDNPEAIVKAYLYGDWNIHEGVAFNEMVQEKHLIDPIELPLGTVYFAGYDHGYNHPFAFVLFAVTPDSSVYVINYIKNRLLRVDEISKQILKLLQENNIKKIDMYCGLDCWSRGRDGSPTIAEQFEEFGLTRRNGVNVLKGYNNRVQGVNEIRKFIAWRNTEQEKPKLQFFNNTRGVFDTVAGMQFDTLKPEDVMKVDAVDGVGGDDLYDAFRYGLVSRIKTPKVPESEYPENSIMKLLLDDMKKEQMYNNLGEFL